MWTKLDDLLDGKHRLKTISIWISYIVANLAVTFVYCYQITPQWH